MTEASGDALSMREELAIKRLNELLEENDTIEKKEEVLGRLKEDLSTVRTQIQSSVDQRLTDIDLSKQSVADAVNLAGKIERENSKIDKVFTELQDVAADHGLLEKASIIFNFCASVRTVVRGLASLDDEIHRIAEMLHGSDTADDIEEPYLLPIHYALHKVNLFRDRVVSQTKDSNLDVKSTLSQYFEDLDALNTRFETLITEMSKNLLLIAKSDCPSLLVRIAKVIYKEEVSDAQVLSYREYLKKSSNADQNQDSVHQQQNLISYSGTVRRYKQKFDSAVNQGIRDKFLKAKEHYDNDYLKFFKKSKWIFDDLQLVLDVVVDCFPPTWNFFQMYVSYVHSQIDTYVNQFMQSDPDNASALELLDWINYYYQKMEDKFNITRDHLQPPLLGGDESRLVDDYTNIIVQKLEEWATKVRSDDIEAFQKRSTEPEMVDSKYTLPGTSTLFQMINQQIELAVSTKFKTVLPKLIPEILRVLSQHLDEWISIMNTEVEIFREAPENASSGLLEYIIALGNHFYQCCEFVNKILPQTKEDSSDPGDDLKVDVKRLADRFTDAADDCVKHLVELFENDVRQIYSKLFATEWYDEEFMGSIIETFKEYLELLDTRSYSFFRIRFQDHWFRSFFQHYISAARAKGKPFRSEQTVTRIGKDFEPLIGFIKDHISEDMEVFEGFTVIDTLIIELLECQKATDFSEFVKKLYSRYPDVPQNFVADLLSKHKKLGKSAQKECLEILKEVSASSDDRTTFFSNLCNSQRSSQIMSKNEN